MKKIKDIFLWIYGLFGTKNKANWKVVALCLLAATTFWFFNALNKSNYTTRLNYPIVFNFNDSSTVLVEKLPEQITLDVSGGGWNLLRRVLGFDANPLQIDLEQPTSTKYIMASTLEPVIARQISEITLNYVVTDTLPINIEPKISRRLNVNVDTANIDLRKSYQIVSDIVSDPDTIWVTGPESMIKALSDTAHINILEENIDEDFDEQMPIASLGSDLIELNPSAVNVRFSVIEFVKERRKVLLSLQNFPRDSSAYLDVTEADISFYFREDMEKELNLIELEVVADFRKLNSKDSTIVLRIDNQPDFIQNVVITSDTLKVNYATVQ